MALGGLTSSATHKLTPDRKQSIAQHRKSLPIASVEKRLVGEVRDNDVLIIVGETGSGKTTQLPQFLFEAGFCEDGGMIGVTQPRRVAAVTVAERVAEECGVELGQRVGYSIRFEDVTSNSTKIKYMTDGLLLREALLVFQIHLDEGPGDILVFLTGQEEIESLEDNVQKQFRHLPQGSQKLLTLPIYSSLPSEQQMRVFAHAPAGYRKVILATNIAETSVTIPGIRYVIDPGLVKVLTYDPAKGMESLVIVPTSKAQALQRSGRAGREGPGKCFRLYQESEFEKMEDSTRPEIKRCNLSNVILQLKAMGVDDIIGFDFMDKPPRAAIIKSLEQLFLLGALSNDCKLSDPVGHQIARLPLNPIYSKALMVSTQFKCAEEMLMLVAMLSVNSIFYSPRDKRKEAKKARKSFTSADGDHLILVNVYRASNKFLLEKKKAGVSKDTDERILMKWCKDNFINGRSLRHAHDICSQIREHMQQMGLQVDSCGDDMSQLRRCLAASFFLNAALKQPDGTYRALASGEEVQIHPSSTLFHVNPECVIFNELVQTQKKYMRRVTKIEYIWLTELAPHCYNIC